MIETIMTTTKVIMIIYYVTAINNDIAARKNVGLSFLSRKK